MILCVSIHHITKQVFVTDMENGVTWSKENVEKMLKCIEENNLQHKLGNDYIALKDAQKAIKIAENRFNK